ncbi:SDR family NAD(P)-dependent oxidoreductase [Streptomyces violaceorubidus]|uniref:SDR family NAD(P)-dependent oxidoreductase n=1 Tax=Streptomyces violaceorubidus TaxID=284042 RepID=A0ABV1T312_9ACTN
MADEHKLLDYLKRAGQEMQQLRRRLREAESADREPVAVIAMSCRYPGGVRSPEDLWRLVEEGGDAIAEVPAERGWYLDRPARGGFLDDAAHFDPAFFGMSPREALATDPQQRLALEIAWEAVERAGIRPGDLTGTDVSVFVGSNGQDYWDLLAHNPELSGGASAAAAIISGRLSYTFGWEGPSLSVDTACSSSLVAVHLAMRSLRSGESSLALAGGVTVMATPRVFVEFARQDALSPDGRCRSFADEANGTGWAEGAGMLLLERLSDARRNGHPVLAVLRGSAVNQDGASHGFTAPNGPAQQRVIRKALTDARLSAADVDLVEAHGTGTRLGDPIEAQALLATYGQDRPDGRPLYLGSLKSNIGHSQAAAGVGGIIKVVQAMRHAVLPRTLHAGTPSSHVDWDAGAVRLLDRARPWGAPREAPRRAGVSSFGVSGTNAHVIVEEATETLGEATGIVAGAAEPGADVPSAGEPPVPLLLSAGSPAALCDQAALLLPVLAAHPTLDVARSLATTREVFEHRACVVAEDRETLAAGLRALARGDDAAGLIRGVPRTGRTAFVFPGQGAQRAGTGRLLAARHPVFARAYEEVLDHFGPSLREALADQALLDRTEHAQPALFAVQVALFRLLESWGVRPDRLVGHSIGEFAAAHVAGVFGLADACRLVAARGRLMQALPDGGVMIALSASEDEVRPLLAEAAGQVAIAAVNGPRAVVVAGDEGPATALAARFAAEGRRTRRLAVSHAFHSPLMAPVLDDFRAVAESVRYGEPSVPVVSTVTGRTAGSAMCGADYWVAHVHSTVRFADAVAELARQGVTTFVETGPGGALSAMVRESAPEADCVPALRDGRPEDAALVTALAQAHVHGTGIDWDRFFAAVGGRTVPLPTYPFQHESFWPRVSALPRGAGEAHPLLDTVVHLADSTQVLFTGTLSPRRQPWLTDHKVAGELVVPGTAVLEMALRAARTVSLPHLAELVLHTPLVVPADGALSVQLRVAEPAADGSRRLDLYAGVSGGAGPWTHHADGRLTAVEPDPAPPSWAREWPPAGACAVDPTGWYGTGGHFEYGPAFQGLTAVWRRDGEVFAEAALPHAERADADAFAVHPALLDTVLHASLCTGPEEPAARMPWVWNGVSTGTRGVPAVRARLRPLSSDTLALDITDIAGGPVLRAEGLTLRRTAPDQRARRALTDEALFHGRWTSVETADAPRPADWLVVRDLSEVPRSVPGVVLLPAGGHGGGDVPGAVRELTAQALADVRAWLSEKRFAEARLVFVTTGAVRPVPDGPPADLAAASVWGLVRSAQAEHPGRFHLVDLDTDDVTVDAVAAAVATGEPQVAVRHGVVHVFRLARASSSRALTVPAEAANWRLQVGDGTLDELVLAADPRASTALTHGQVRVDVRAIGLNFRDVLTAVGMYPGAGAGPAGAEAAGVVSGTGPGVTRFAVGDRVMGLFPDGAGRSAVTDDRMLSRFPAEWSFPQAASVSVTYLTAYHALVERAGLRAGESVLVHAGAGGVGMAAIALARHLGAEVFTTAGVGKWPAVRRLGIAEDHIASSRSVEFEHAFRRSTGGRGVDVVLNSLSGEFVDASVRLLAPGGRFLELGKTDVRRPEDHPGVSYQAFDLFEAGAERIGGMFAALAPLFADGTLPPPPVTAWDIRRAPEAFRFVSQARHVGKVVLTFPRPPAPDGTVLITGGTGSLGRALARHLVDHHGARRLLLVGRRGGADDLVRDLTERGATVRVVACDVSDRAALADVLRGIPAQHPLTAVVHAAGVLDDGMVTDLTDGRLARVLRPKADAAWHLHELTRGADLAAFVLFSSVSGTLPAAGQANYSAANAFLDALAEHRATLGLPVTSVGWGPWAADTGDGGMAGTLSDAGRGRLTRSGIVQMPAQDGLALFDHALADHHPAVIAARFDLRALSAGTDLPPALADLVTRPAGPAGPSSPPPRGVRGTRQMLDLVRAQAALVLGHASPEAVRPGLAFQDAGFDSLTAVELRNRLEKTTGVPLSATAVFDHPTPDALAAFLVAASAPPGVPAGADDETRPHSAAADPENAEDTDDPVVVVGMACRYPGGVSGPEDLWNLVSEGREGITAFPADRGWDVAAVYDPDRKRAGTTYTNRGGFVGTATTFDAEFFGISPREALGTDPQQRLLLETAWEGIERAGIDPRSLRGSRTGVFAGLIYHDYADLGGFPEAAADYLGTGTAGSVATGRVSYLLGLEGPAVTVDTACSSSLVAVHLAAQALRAGECTLALAGGATVLATPAAFVEFSRQGVLSADGHCRSFADGAAGSVWSEGVGVLVLERLSKARREGHEVLAVLRGSAVNQDGASNGLTAPNGPSQQRVIRQALAAAGLHGADVDAVEAHGTATELGDPIEAQALLATYGQDRGTNPPLWLGSVKSNIGHTQAAAGVAGVIKTVMALRHGTLPRTLHARTPSSKVAWSTGAVELLTESRPWPETGRPRRAAVSSFGISGTNAHVILEQAPADPARRLGTDAAACPPPLLLSATSARALRSQAAALLSHLRRSPGVEFADVGHTLARARASFDHRAVVLGGDQDSVRAGLAALASGRAAPRLIEGRAQTGTRCVFVFPGQGAQWAGMARELLAWSPAFSARLRECAAALAPYTDWSLLDVIGDGGPLDRVDVVQPALWAVMVSLAELWRSWGVEPTAVVGHSQGEVAAAVVAGGLSLQDGALVVTARSRLIAKELAGTGGMASVAAPAPAVGQLIARCGERVSLAAENGPGSCVVSGSSAAIDEFTALCRADGVDVRRIAVDYASHSPEVDILREGLLRRLAGVRAGESDVPFFSSVTGDLMDTALADGTYWLANLRETVWFGRATRAALTAGHTVFVEVGPHPVLASGLAATLAEAGSPAAVIGTLRRDEDSRDSFLHSLAQAHVLGVPVNWAPLYAGRRTVALPTYPFQRERFWPRGGHLPARAGDRRGGSAHPLLTASVELPDGGGQVFAARLSPAAHPWLDDCRIEGVAVLPPAAVIELAAYAARTLGGTGVETLTLDSPVVVPDGGLLLQLVADAADGPRPFTVWARPDEETGTPWRRCGSGRLGSDTTPHAPADPGADLRPSAGAREIDTAPYPGLTGLWQDGDALVCEASLPWDTDGAGFAPHPVLLDAVTAPAASLLPGDPARRARVWEDVHIHARGVDAVRVRLTASGDDTVAAVATALDGEAVASVRLSGFRGVRRDELAARPGTVDAALYRVGWEPVSAELPDDTDEETWFTVVRGHLDVPGAVPGTVVLDTRGTAGEAADVPAAVHAASHRALALLRSWLADTRFDASRLVVVTEAGFEGAAVSGLVRTAQAEHPGRLVLLDLDTPVLTPRTLATAIVSGEPVLRVREGAVWAARLAEQQRPAATGPEWDREGTVVITGGTGGIGREVARHLVTAHGVRHLVLAGRRGPAADGVTDLVAELSRHGADVTVRACDVGDRGEVEALLAAVPAEHPLTAVVHSAGIHQGGIVENLSAERLHTVLRPKVDGAWHLHELTRDLPLAGFVVFSSFSGIAGAAGQANYAAANAFLDELVRHRHAQGLPATALAWGLWTREFGFTSRLDQVDLTRMLRSGVTFLSVPQGLELFDAGIRAAQPAVIAMALDHAVVRAAGEIPALLRTLVSPAPARARTAGGATADLERVLAPLPTAERERVLLDVVRTTASAVLGHAGPERLPDDRAFRESGFDSLTAIDLRNRLGTATGLRLPATAVFDHPTPRALARHLAERLAGSPARPAPSGPRRPATAVAEPVAIVGMACRFPGGVGSPDELWRLLRDGGDAITPFPDDRGWDLESLYDPSGERPATTYALRGGFLHEAGDFDAGFFGISPREALAMDPQQRLLLETSWEALEAAGIAPSTLHGSTAGVFVGGYHQGYADRAGSAADELRGHLMTGNTSSALSGRVSYVLGLEGPSVTVDTACSSSLVATHWATRALRAGECSLALAGGVTVMAQPDVFTEFSKLNGLSPDGRCKPFAAAADGTALAEGVGILVLERLSDARRNGHEVLAVIRGSAVNSDGASNGLSAPSGPSQQRVISQALADADLEPAQVDAVEAHGTGTALGDPIEAQALLAAYGQERESPLLVGALKSNLGHTQAAAGVAGVMKMVLAMRHGLLPATLHTDAPTPRVDWEEGAVELLTRSRPWPSTGRVRRAAVSAFGISGTNAHLVLEQPAQTEAVDDTGSAPRRGPVPWLLSAATPEALRAQAGRLLTGTDAGASAADVGLALSTTRDRLRHRAAVVAEDTAAFSAALETLARGADAPGVLRGEAGTPRLVVLFTGQGAQRSGMGRELHARFPAFAASLDATLGFLDTGSLPSTRDVLFAGAGTPEADLLHRTGHAQPALFALEVALYRLFESWGLRPDLLIGHSVGEIAAAHVAGVLDLPDACRLVSARARLMEALPSGQEHAGCMVAVEAPEADVRPLVEPLADRVSVAAVNGPSSLVLSGDETAVLAVTAGLARGGVRVSRLDVSHAFHSPHMDPMLAEFRAELGGLVFRPAAVPLVSTVLGREVPEDGMASADYWVRQVRATVRFGDAVARAAELGAGTALELGPDGVLSALAGQSAPDLSCVAAMRRGRPETQTLMSAVAALHVRGCDLDGHALFAGTAARRTALPTYPFQRERYWIGTAPVPRHRGEPGATAASAPATAADLFRVEWTEAPVLPLPDTTGWVLAGPELPAGTPEVVVLPLPAGGDGGDPAEAARELAGRVLDQVQRWLADDRLLHSRLVFVTHDAALTGGRPSLAHTAAHGLIRSAQSEHPGRFVLVDLDCADVSVEAVAPAVATGEPETAVREGRVLVPRLEAAAPEGPSASARWNPAGSVLITGGTGGLGRALARHLVARRGVRHLVLAGRRGGAEDLVAELAEHGARVRVVACDTADRAALERLLASIPDAYPLTAVVHAAGVLDDGVIGSLTPERLARVFRPKASAAWHLHELTLHHDLDAFVLFSSAAGLLGAPAQAGYAAANTFLDALAAHRRELGLPGTSLAWGPWADTGMTRTPQGVERRGPDRTGLRPLSVDEGLDLFDRSLRGEAGVLLATRPDLPAIRALEPMTPALFRSLLPAGAPRQEQRGGAGQEQEALLRRLAAVPPSEGLPLVSDLVRAQVAAVLALPGAASVDVRRPFSEIGFDSLTAVDLRNRLEAATGVPLPAAVVFDHPTVSRLATHLLDSLRAGSGRAAAGLFEGLDRLERAFALAGDDPGLRARLATRLHALLTRVEAERPEPAEPGEQVPVEDLSDEALFSFIDEL